MAMLVITRCYIAWNSKVSEISGHFSRSWAQRWFHRCPCLPCPFRIIAAEARAKMWHVVATLGTRGPGICDLSSNQLFKWIQIWKWSNFTLWYKLTVCYWNGHLVRWFTHIKNVTFHSYAMLCQRLPEGIPLYRVVWKQDPPHFIPLRKQECLMTRQSHTRFLPEHDCKFSSLICP